MGLIIDIQRFESRYICICRIVSHKYRPLHPIPSVFFEFQLLLFSGTSRFQWCTGAIEKLRVLGKIVPKATGRAGLDCLLVVGLGMLFGVVEQFRNIFVESVVEIR